MVLKKTFFEIIWLEHFIFHQILTKLQHCHHFWAKSSLQVGMYLIIHTCKLIFTQWWWKCWNIVKIWWKMKFSNNMISKNVFFTKKLDIISKCSPNEVGSQCYKYTRRPNVPSWLVLLRWQMLQYQFWPSPKILFKIPPFFSSEL